MNALQKPYFLGISGGSASGKTTLLRKLIDHYPNEAVTLISQDNYYISRDDLPRDLTGEINFDHPSAIDLDALAKDLRKLMRGESFELPEYTYNNPDIVPRTITYHPAKVVIVEGLFVFNNPQVADLLDLKVFVDTAEHLRLSRRIRRDAAERGYGLDSVLNYYAKFVSPMYKKHIEPFKEICDLIIPNNSKMDNAIGVMIHHLDRVIGQ